jgi:hypothetical protein
MNLAFLPALTCLPQYISSRLRYLTLWLERRVAKIPLFQGLPNKMIIGRVLALEDLVYHCQQVVNNAGEIQSR